MSILSCFFLICMVLILVLAFRILVHLSIIIGGIIDAMAQSHRDLSPISFPPSDQRPSKANSSVDNCPCDDSSKDYQEFLRLVFLAIYLREINQKSAEINPCLGLNGCNSPVLLGSIDFQELAALNEEPEIHEHPEDVFDRITNNPTIKGSAFVIEGDGIIPAHQGNIGLTSSLGVLKYKNIRPKQSRAEYIAGFATLHSPKLVASNVHAQPTYDAQFDFDLRLDFDVQLEFTLSASTSYNKISGSIQSPIRRQTSAARHAYRNNIHVCSASSSLQPSLPDIVFLTLSKGKARMMQNLEKEEDPFISTNLDAKELSEFEKTLIATADYRPNIENLLATTSQPFDNRSTTVIESGSSVTDRWGSRDRLSATNRPCNDKSTVVEPKPVVAPSARIFNIARNVCAVETNITKGGLVNAEAFHRPGLPAFPILIFRWADTEIKCPKPVRILPHQVYDDKFQLPTPKAAHFASPLTSWTNRYLSLLGGCNTPDMTRLRYQLRDRIYIQVQRRITLIEASRRLHNVSNLDCLGKRRSSESSCGDQKRARNREPKGKDPQRGVEDNFHLETMWKPFPLPQTNPHMADFRKRKQTSPLNRHVHRYRKASNETVSTYPTEDHSDSENEDVTPDTSAISSESDLDDSTLIAPGMKLARTQQPQKCHFDSIEETQVLRLLPMLNVPNVKPAVLTPPGFRATGAHARNGFNVRSRPAFDILATRPLGLEIAEFNGLSKHHSSSFQGAMAFTQVLGLPIPQLPPKRGLLARLGIAPGAHDLA